MYCGECGAKNKKGALFCEECGAKLEVEETPKKENKSTKKTVEKKSAEKKKFPTKYKILIGAGAALIVFLIVLFSVLSNLASPQHIVDRYIKAINERDYDTLYEYASFNGDTTFVTKETYKRYIQDRLDDEDKISNYRIGNVVYEDGGLTAKVTVNCQVKSGSSFRTQHIDVALSKQQGRKYLFFDKWALSDQSSLGIDLIDNYEIKVPKGSKVTFGGVKLTSKYLSNSKKSLDTYKLPQVFRSKTSLEVTLPSGIKIKKDITPSSYSSSYSLSISMSDFSDSELEKIKKSITDGTNTLMKGILEDKNYSEIKDKFGESNDDEDSYYTSYNIKDRYDKEKDKVKNYSSYTISDYNTKSVEIRSISFTENYELSVRVRVSYEFKTKSKTGDKTEDKSSYDYITYKLTYDKGYKVSGINDLPSTYVYFF